MSIQHIRQLVNEELIVVNQFIRQQIMIEHPLVADMTKHLLEGGGKQLRPLIALLSCKAFDYSGDNHLSLASLIEFFHTATLLHDDVVDESTLRRGRKTANQIWGSKASVLVGDYLFTLYFRLLLSVGDLAVVQFMTDIANQIGYGEIKQLVNQYHYDISMAEYFEVIQAKTSLLFAASAKLAAMICQQPPEVCNHLYHYGLHLGNAFQLIDDALDYCSDSQTIGKNIGDDLADGKATLPILHALRMGTNEQKNMIQHSLKHGLRENLPQIIEAIQTTHAIEFTQQTALKEAEAAKKYLQILEPSVYKDALLELADYSISRDH